MARKPVNQWIYANSSAWLFIFILHLINSRSSESYLGFASNWIGIAVFLLIWPTMTTGRLVDIGLDGRWILLFASPWVAFVVTTLRGPNWAWPVALIILIISQSFLVLRTKPMQPVETVQEKVSAE
jgi:uncharacterized membrane protein YhaH (DUF805 family)